MKIEEKRGKENETLDEKKIKEEKMRLDEKRKRRS